MNRREALKGVAALAAMLWDVAPSGCRNPDPLALAFADEENAKITRIDGYWLAAERPRFIGKNSQFDIQGQTVREFLWRIETSAGIEGLGAGPDSAELAAQMLGADPFAFYRPQERAMTSPLGRWDMALWDLIGKVLEQPVYVLLGDEGSRQVPVYDGSIYFSDLLPQNEQRGVSPILEEIDQGLEAGHRTFKVKVGRGARWLPRAEGDRRDIEVLQGIRAHHGSGVQLFIDANNGYDLEGTKRLFEAVGALDIRLAEEMFPEVTEEDLELKRFFTENGWHTLIADGESAASPEHFREFIDRRALDIVQPDIVRFGLTLLLQMDRSLRNSGVRLAPHNWGSLLGFYTQLHLGRAIPTFYYAEHDPLTSAAIIPEGYVIQSGRALIPDAPGLGLTLNTSVARDVLEPAWCVTR